MALAAFALVVGAIWASHGLPPFQLDATDVCPGYQLEEGTGYKTDQSWVPGVIDCEYTTVVGDLRNTRAVLWREDLVVALFASAIGVGTSSLLRGAPHRPLKIAAACGLFLASWIALFA